MKKSTDYLPDPSTQVLPSAFALFGPSWQAVRRNLVTIIEFTILPILINALVFLLLRRPGEASFMDVYTGHTGQLQLGFGYIASLVVSGVITLVLAPALTLTYLRSTAKQTVDLWPAFKASLPFWWRYLGMTVLIGLATAVGFVLFIIPGLFVLQRYFLAGYFMIDQKLGIKDSLKASREASKHYSGPVWGLLGVILLINIVGSALGSVFFLSNFLSEVLLLIYACAPAVRYRQIKQALKAS